MNPSFAASLVSPSRKTFGDCFPTNPRSSWYPCNEHALETNVIWNVPATTASTRIESSSAVHLELGAMSSVEYLAKKGGMWRRGSTNVPPF